MKENKKDYNSLVRVVETERNGKKYHNIIVSTKLENGEVVEYQVKLAFWNKKFAYKLENQLPR